MSTNTDRVGLADSDLDSLMNRIDKVKVATPAPRLHAVTSKRPMRSYNTGFETLPGYSNIKAQRAFGAGLGIANPYYNVHETQASAHSQIGGQRVLNFSSYDYLGLNGHPQITQAVQAAAAEWGTSVSASRMTAGERAIHQELEAELAALYEADDCAVFVSGHGSAVSTVAALMGPKDLIIHDAVIHNCVVVGAQCSGATRRAYPHNDLDALEAILERERDQYDRAMIATEGLFSMDGDGIDLARLIDLKERFGTWLLVDDAHGLGVMGETGRGVFEHVGVSPDRVDIWLGTLSKSMVSCGGYVAGSQPLIDYLKAYAPGFVYSVGMPVTNAVAALEAIRLMKQEPERVARVQDNGLYFLEGAKARGLDTGPSWGLSIIPIMVGDSLRTAGLADRLMRKGINSFPVLPPGVPEKSARLRFFVTSEHTKDELDQALDCIQSELAALLDLKFGLDQVADLELLKSAFAK
ncbi:MAG: aminotransferase class I/II-fold pyridoxal phosphate-dependent enzyme [Devosiaceae bacterium]|nr:aminotransferase class I/II-fold pyridoxal phosphate-dependent enzyme [Devosiaceae bacterium MH13]